MTVTCDLCGGVLGIEVLLEYLDLVEFKAPYDIICHHIEFYPSEVFTDHRICLFDVG